MKKENKIIIRRGDKNMVSVKKMGVYGLNTKGQTAGTCGCGSSTKTTNGVNVVGRPIPTPQFWETDIEIQTVKSCGVFGDTITINVDILARGKMDYLMRKFEKCEWLAYLIGDKNTYTVTDIIIPKQRVTSVRVDVEAPVDVPIIGVIHSHHDMGNGFSGTDDDYINQNHDISLCITNTKITGQVRVKTECGRFFLADAKVEIKNPSFDVVEFDKEIDNNIKKHSYQYISGGVGINTHTSRSYINGGCATTPVLGGRFDDMFESDYIDFDGLIGTGLPSSMVVAQTPNEVLAEIEAYRESISDVKDVDAFYSIEFNMLIGLIRSIGAVSFDDWETMAFESQDNLYTSDYYRLIDEISLYGEQLNNQELMSLRGLANELEKRIDVSQTN